MKYFLSAMAVSAFMVSAAHAQEDTDDMTEVVTESCARSPIVASGNDFCGEPVAVVRTRERTRSYGRSRRSRATR